MRTLILVTLVLLGISCNRAVFRPKWTAEKAPSAYVVRFETSKGIFDVKVTREWSLLAADRFYQLVRHHYYDSCIFYRVVPNFVAQFGSGDTVLTEKWMKHKLKDEEVLHSNQKGSISFARGGKETRGSDLFVNLKDNPRLDTVNFYDVKGFPAFGDVIKGMEVVTALYSGYGDSSMAYLDTLYRSREQFLKSFPNLDVIGKAYLLKK